jgi:hypothetical protein
LEALVAAGGISLCPTERVLSAVYGMRDQPGEEIGEILVGGWL